MVCVILIAEDEVMIRNYVRHLLEAEGHDVLAAADGAEALALSRRFSGKIDLLITDVIMPRLDGLGLIRQILQERPDLRILIMSAKPVDSHDIFREFPFLRKPFASDVLRDKVRQILGNSGAI